MKQPPEEMTDEELIHFCEMHSTLSARAGFMGKTVRRMLELAGIAPPDWLHDGDLFVFPPGMRYVMKRLVCLAGGGLPAVHKGSV